MATRADRRKYLRLQLRERHLRWRRRVVRHGNDAGTRTTDIAVRVGRRCGEAELPVDNLGGIPLNAKRRGGSSADERTVLFEIHLGDLYGIGDGSTQCDRARQR